jgi:hypothetical protein
MTTFWGGRKERKKKRTALFLLFAYFLCRRRFVAPFGPFPGKMEKKIKRKSFIFPMKGILIRLAAGESFTNERTRIYTP